MTGTPLQGVSRLGIIGPEGPPICVTEVELPPTIPMKIAVSRRLEGTFPGVNRPGKRREKVIPEVTFSRPFQTKDQQRIYYISHLVFFVIPLFEKAGKR